MACKNLKSDLDGYEGRVHPLPSPTYLGLVHKLRQLLISKTTARRERRPVRPAQAHEPDSIVAIKFTARYSKGLQTWP